MSVQPCGTPAGTMMMSPVLTTRRTTSPTIAPLHDGPFRIVVTGLPGADRVPFMITPPVMSVRLPEV